MIAGIESPWRVRELSEASGDSSSPQALATIKRWQRACREDHSDCNRSSLPNSKPDRVLELTKDRVTLRRGIDLPDQIHYACLSHCWGPKGPSFKLTSETFDALLGGIEITQLPQTFQDVANLCLQLDIDHLWIDALCKYTKGFLPK